MHDYADALDGRLKSKQMNICRYFAKELDRVAEILSRLFSSSKHGRGSMNEQLVSRITIKEEARNTTAKKDRLLSLTHK